VKKLLREQFGADVNLNFYMKGKNRIYAFGNCNFEVDDVHRGIYFGTLESDGLRLSIEGSFLVGKEARKGVLEVDDEDAVRWLSGEDIAAKVRGYWIVKWGNYFLGCGKGNGLRLRNYVPKDRRVIH
jgi:NOL1/NOP2/fmu family ribosome biogenesis protein